MVTQWVSVSNLDVHVFVQARNGEDQTNINPATVEIELVNNLNSDIVTNNCTVMTPSGICSVVISIPVQWFDTLTADRANVVSVTASLTPSGSPINLGSLNVRYEATCPYENNVLIFTPTYSQFSGSLAYVPVYAHATEGVDSFSIEFEIGSLLELYDIQESEYFCVTSTENPDSFIVTGSTSSFPVQTGSEILLFTLVLTVKYSTICTDQFLSAKVLFLSDGLQQSVSIVYFYSINNFLLLYVLSRCWVLELIHCTTQVVPLPAP